MTQDALRCEECGAPLTVLADASECEGMFHAALAMEWEDPPHTARAHHLLVSTYMLQHPSRLTREAEQEYRSILRTVVDEGIGHEELRERLRGKYDQSKRTWNIRARRSRPIVPRRWSATIADVVKGPAAGLPDRVRRWAEAVRSDLGREDGEPETT